MGKMAVLIAFYYDFMKTMYLIHDFPCDILNTRKNTPKIFSRSKDFSGAVQLFGQQTGRTTEEAER